MIKKRTNRQIAIDSKIKEALDKLFDEDQEISARAVIRNIEELSAASSITRDPIRMKMVNDYQEKQNETKAWSKRIKKAKRYSDSKVLQEKDSKIRKLEHQVELLIGSHKAMILAIGEFGGMKGWLRFFEQYQEILDELLKIGALPSPTSNVITFPEE